MTLIYPRYYKLGKSYRLTSLEIKQMKRLKAKGWTNIKLASKFGVSPAGVRYHCNPQAHEYYLNRLREKTKNESQSEKNIRNKRDYNRKKELFKRNYLDYIQIKRKLSPSYTYGGNLNSKLLKRLTPQEKKIFEQFYTKIKPKLKKLI